jgi:nucleoside-diphosphate-sugar epimerase
MRIFLTGGTGYIGSAVLDALVRAGHEITALVRSKAKAGEIDKPGTRAVIGELNEPASYQHVASRHDGFIHAASDPVRGAETDRTAIETLLAVARTPGGSESGSRFLIYTSGVWVLGNTRQPAAEDAPLDPPAIVQWRPALEKLVLDGGGEGVRTIVVRPGILYGGSRGIIGDIFRSGRNGLIRVIGNGLNHWALIYDRDLADLYAKLAANDDASGLFHANDEGDERVNDLVEALASHFPTRPDVRHVPLEEARTKLGPYADALALDQIVRCSRAKALGWSPQLHSVAGNAARLRDEWKREQQ